MSVTVNTGQNSVVIVQDGVNRPQPDDVKPGVTTTSAGELDPTNGLRVTTTTAEGTTQRDGANGADEVTLYETRTEASPLTEVNAKVLMAESGGVSMQAIFKELFDLGKLLKAVARTDREARLDSMEALAKSAAQEIRSSALCSIIATSISSVGQIVGGSVALRGATISQETYNSKMSELTTAKLNELSNPKLNVTDTPKTPTDTKVTDPKFSGDGPSKLKSDTDIEMKEIKTDAKLKPDAEVKDFKSGSKPTTDTEIETKDIKSDVKLKNDGDLEKTGPKVQPDAEQPDPKTDQPKKLETADFIAIEKLARDAATQAGAKFSAISTIASGGGQLLGGIPTYISQQFEAKRAEEQAASSREQARADEQSEFKQAAEKLISTVLDKLSEIERAQSQAMSSIARLGG